MSRWSRVLGVCCGVAMLVAGLLVLGGNAKWGAVLMAGAGLVLALGPLAEWRRSG